MNATEHAPAVCRACGEGFEAKPHQIKKRDFRCPGCERAARSEWRKARRAAGLRASGSKTWDPAKQEAWRARYYADPSVRARKTQQIRESSARHPDHVAARRKVRHEIEVGRMQRQPCVVCGASPAHAHHDDYSRPLDVRWLCRKHHDEHHAKATGGAR